MDPQVFFHPFPILELQTFPSKSFTRANGNLHTEKSNFDFWIKIKLQESYFLKTCWNVRFVSSRNSKVKFYFGKVKSKYLEIFLSV